MAYIETLNSFNIAPKDAVRAFATVADMQAATDLDVGVTCHTNGFHVEGDGGAAYYTISAEGTANGMDVLACEDGLIASLIVAEPYVNVKQLGAVDDDTTDCKAVFDRAIAIVYELNPLTTIQRDNPKGGGVVFVPNGAYHLSAAITNSSLTANITFLGESKEACTISSDAAFFVDIAASDTNSPWNIAFENLSFVRCGVSIVKAYNTRFTNCRFYLVNEAVRLYLAVGVVVENCYFTGCAVGLVLSGAAGSGPSTTVTVRYCWFSHNTRAFYALFARNSLVSTSCIDCIFEYNTEAVICTGNATANSSIELRRIHFEQNTQTSVIRDFSALVDDCWFDSIDTVSFYPNALNECYVTVPRDGIASFGSGAYKTAKRIAFNVEATGELLDTLLGIIRKRNTKQFILSDGYVPTKCGIVIEYHSDTKNCMSYGTFTRGNSFSLTHLMESFATNGAGTIAITDDSATDSFLTIRYRPIVA